MDDEGAMRRLATGKRPMTREEEAAWLGAWRG